MGCFSKASRQRHKRSIAERTEEDAANQQLILAHVREHPAQRRAAVRGVGPLDGKFGCGHGRRRVRGIGHGAGKSIQRGAEYSMIKAGRERDPGILVCSQHSGWGLRCADRDAGVRLDIGVETLRCRKNTCGGAWVGVDQALEWCGEWCGLPNQCCRQCAFFACYGYQISANTTRKRSLT